MKVISKIKKIILSVGIAIISLSNRVFVLNPADFSAVVRTPMLYGMPKPNPVSVIWRISKVIIIPLALIIGLIIYFKKSKSSVKKKIFITIIVIAIIVLVYFIGNKLILYI